MVKLLTKWILDPKYDTHSYRNDPPGHIISNGIWETHGVIDTNGDKIFTMTCIWSFRNNTPVGKQLSVREDLLIELCCPIEIKILPKLTSMLEERRRKNLKFETTDELSDEKQN